MGIHLTISRKFAVVMAMVAPLTIAIALVGTFALTSLKGNLSREYGSDLQTGGVSVAVGFDLARAEVVALQLAVVTNTAERRQLNLTLDEQIIPGTDAGLAQLSNVYVGQPDEIEQVARLARGWGRFMALRSTGVFAAQRSPGAVRVGAGRLSRQISAIFDPLQPISRAEGSQAGQRAGGEQVTASRTYDQSLRLIWGITLAALLVGVSGVLMLTRNVVPRVRRYSQFAAAVAQGDLSGRLTPEGGDELTALAQALNDMVQRRSAASEHYVVQNEFVDALQVTDREEVAHDLLKRQIERSIPVSTVVVLNRNNSENRLEATTELEGGSPLRQTLVDAKPRSCMAVLYSRPHQEAPEREPLTHCEICGKIGRTTCEPLVVGGEVIGSVLVEHPEPLDEQSTTALRESVSQAAPVLANLRNLALAQLRASTDGLTGLPNKRAIQDTIKRMTAQATRAGSPLSAIAFDLDHFKQINDTYGHGRGDDVLAAVSTVLTETVRASDFVGRDGGEEFIVLLPDTDTEHAWVVAEKLRAAIAGITVPGVGRAITASLGIATIPDHAADSDQLVRTADRALYAAKTNGRNRAEVAITGQPTMSRDSEQLVGAVSLPSLDG